MTRIELLQARLHRQLDISRDFGSTSIVLVYASETDDNALKAVSTYQMYSCCIEET